MLNITTTLLIENEIDSVMPCQVTIIKEIGITNLLNQFQFKKSNSEVFTTRPGGNYSSIG